MDQWAPFWVIWCFICFIVFCLGGRIIVVDVIEKIERYWEQWEQDEQVLKTCLSFNIFRTFKIKIACISCIFYIFLWSWKKQPQKHAVQLSWHVLTVREKNMWGNPSLWSPSGDLLVVWMPGQLAVVAWMHRCIASCLWTWQWPHSCWWPILPSGSYSASELSVDSGHLCWWKWWLSHPLSFLSYSRRSIPVLAKCFFSSAAFSGTSSAWRCSFTKVQIAPKLQLPQGTQCHLGLPFCNLCNASAKVVIHPTIYIYIYLIYLISNLPGLIRLPGFLKNQWISHPRLHFPSMAFMRKQFKQLTYKKQME